MLFYKLLTFALLASVYAQSDEQLNEIDESVEENRNEESGQINNVISDISPEPKAPFDYQKCIANCMQTHPRGTECHEGCFMQALKNYRSVASYGSYFLRP